MKKIIASVILFFLFIPSIKGLDIYSNNAILYNLNDNKVIYEKNSDERIAIASLTKITTAITAIEHISSLDDKVLMTSKMFEGLAEANASVAGFKVGQYVTYLDLLYGTLLPSGADATRALAISLSGSEENFVKLMNEKAQNLGLKNTNYANSSGLDNINHYSTVQEVAIMLQYALQNNIFKEIFTSSNYTTSDGKIKMESPLIRNSKKFNLSYDYILGGKTGFTEIAGHCLASIATDKNINYMLITATSDAKSKQPLAFLDAINIYTYVFDNYEYQNILNIGDLLTTLNVNDSNIKTLPVISEQSISAYLPKESNISYQYVGTYIVSPNDKLGNKIGEYLIMNNGEVIQTIDVLLPIDLKVEKATFNFTIIVILIILLIMFIIGRNKSRELKYGN